MSALDFLNFKEFQADVSLVANQEGSGGWEVSIYQGQSKVTLTHQQLDRINKKIQAYIAEGLEEKK